jgi:hypothetical protein
VTLGTLNEPQRAALSVELVGQVPAYTGDPWIIPITGAGTVLVVLGVGLVVIGRRRRQSSI